MCRTTPSQPRSSHSSISRALVLLRERDEQVELGREVAEDRAAGEADLALEHRDGRAVRSRARRTRAARPSGIWRRRSSRWASVTFGMRLTLQKRTDVLYFAAMRNLTLPALLTAEAVSSTGSAMTFVALPWFVLVTTRLADAR